MQIVSNWHSECFLGRKKNGFSSSGLKRIQPIQKIKRKAAKPYTSEELFQFVSGPLNVEAGLKTQIVMEDFPVDKGLPNNKALALTVSNAYDDALKRKIHRMDKGSFYEERV